MAQRKPKRRPMPPGGNILYIGFNAFKPETRRLDARYRGGPVQVTDPSATLLVDTGKRIEGKKHG